ncbi:hypothetical protein Scep_027890 [Stephania cephalantha]|uniref:Aminotransferase-like plant mobile domain-containing protein n=1 Tax=Stephania cephalantha TaxID=152367 RepID=A0AAP0EG95_9MAGN
MGSSCVGLLVSTLGVRHESPSVPYFGYLTLLEGWVYDHFKLGLATPNAKYVDYVHPRVSRWIQKHETVANVDKLGAIRRTLDRLRPSEVTWDPYVNLRENGVVQAMAFYSGKIKYMDVVEPYHPERILRQFGHVQSIPDPPYRPLEAHRGPACKQVLRQVWVRTRQLGAMEEPCVGLLKLGREAIFEFLATPDYLLGSSKCLIPLSRIRSLRTV